MLVDECQATYACGARYEQSKAALDTVRWEKPGLAKARKIHFFALRLPARGDVIQLTQLVRGEGGETPSETRRRRVSSYLDTIRNNVIF